MVELLTDGALYERMSAAARRTAETRFDASLIIPQYERYYREILN